MNPLEAFFGGHNNNITDSQTASPFPQPQEANSIAPPASSKALNELPMVRVTADDLLEENNKECLICLEEQKIGSFACKLPCGHLYHRPCLVDWLQKHCTCPVCRYELETDDPVYEAKRKSKMRARKHRYRRDELEAKTIHQLHELMRDLSVSAAGCIDKRELVERLIRSGNITLTEGLPVIEMSREQFESLGVGELRRHLANFGLSSVGVIEKYELRERLLASGRIELVEGTSEGNDTAQPSAVVSAAQPSSEDFEQVDAMDSTDTLSAADNPAPSSSEPVTALDPPGQPLSLIETQSSSTSAPALPSDRFQIHQDVISSMSIRELKSFMHSFDISTADCVEREEMVKRIRDSNRIDYLID